jgi:calcineurin-like phosphoesterase family protein
MNRTAHSATRVVYVTDTHFNGNSGSHYPRSHAAFPLFMEELLRKKEEIDHLIISGDCVNRGSARIYDLELFRDALESLGITYHVTAGNHDLAHSKKYAAMYPGMEDWEDCPLSETNFGKVFGEKGIREHFSLRDLDVLLFTLRDKDPDGQLEWLESKLSKGLETLVFCHYPVIQSRKGGFCADWGYSRIGEVRQRLTEILEGEQAEVVGYFCGHQHINSRVQSAGTEHIVTGALGTSPYCYRTMDICEEQIRIITHQLAGLSGPFNEVMNADRSADSSHATLRSYHWGNTDERDFTIERGGWSSK